MTKKEKLSSLFDRLRKVESYSDIESVSKEIGEFFNENQIKDPELKKTLDSLISLLKLKFKKRKKQNESLKTSNYVISETQLQFIINNIK
jgi:hypothetical protein